MKTKTTEQKVITNLKKTLRVHMAGRVAPLVLVLALYAATFPAAAQPFAGISSDTNGVVWMLVNNARVQAWPWWAANSPAFSNAVNQVVIDDTNWFGMTNGTLAFPLNLASATGLPYTAITGLLNYYQLDGLPVLGTASHSNAEAFVLNIAGGIAAAGGVTNTVSFGTLLPTAPTNFIINLTNSMYSKIVATNNVNFFYCTNGPGAASIKIRPNGADRLVTFPTNWVWLATNGLALSGTSYSCTITNAGGTTGPMIGWLSVVADGTDPTNVVARFVISP